MDSLPMLPACSLDGDGALAQRERYRAVGAGAHMLRRDARHLVVAVAPDVDEKLVEELIAVEAECCPFFGLGWRADERVLEVSVSRPEHAPALDAIAYALGLEVQAAG
jgi:hypothetical protein